jgi:hypothetical protein
MLDDRPEQLQETATCWFLVVLHRVPSLSWQIRSLHFHQENQQKGGKLPVSFPT